MKILHIIPAYKPAYGYGGPTESVSRLCEGLAAAGHNVDVYATTANGKSELNVTPGEMLNVEGVTVTYFKRITGDHTHISPALWLKLFKTAKNYDVIHIHSWWSICVIVATQVALSTKSKVILAPRGMLSDYVFDSGKRGYKKMIHTFGKQILKKCILHATAHAEYVECRKLIPGWEGFVLPNILSLPDNKVTVSSNEYFAIIFMSRIHPKKGIEKLFEAVSKLSFKVKLTIAGDGEDLYIKQLKKLANELNIDSKIEWIGWVSREQKFTELNDADLLVLTSLNENFANVVIESLYMGTAVLISENVGLADFVKEKDLGWICSLESSDILEKLNEAYHGTDKLNYIRKNGRPIINESFDETILIQKYYQEYLK